MAYGYGYDDTLLAENRHINRIDLDLEASLSVNSDRRTVKGFSYQPGIVKFYEPPAESLCHNLK